MLRILRQGQRWIMAIVVVIVGGFFVLYLGVGAGPGGGGLGTSVVEVAGRSYGARDLQRIREGQEEQYRQALGDAFDARALSEQLDAISAGALVQLGVLASEAERVGLRVSDAEVRRAVRAIPGALDAQGQLRREALRNYAELSFGSERRFVEQQRDQLLANKLLGLVDAGVDVSRAEAVDGVRHRLEEVRFAFVALEEQPPADFAASDDEIDRFLAEQEARVRADYEGNQDRYSQRESVRARHILLRVAQDAAPERVEEARKRAEQILQRLREGADFADVALEASEDPGSKANGGDLGFFERGQMAPAFDEAAFSLEPGKLSDLVRTQFGFHILRVEERRPAQFRSFEQAQREIARELLARDAAREFATATANRLAAAVREGSSLVEAARAEEVPIERTDWLRRGRQGYVPGLGTAPQVLALAFSLPEERPSSDRILRVADKLVLAERLEHRGPTPEEIEAELPTERERLLTERRNRARDLWFGTARERLQAAGQVRVDLSSLRGS